MKNYSFSREEMNQLIGMTKEMEDAAASVLYEDDIYQKDRKLFFATCNGQQDIFFEEIKKRKNYRQYFLAFYLRMAYDCHNTYREWGIEDSIFFDTFRDIPYWVSNCMRDYGEIGIEEYQWLWNHVIMNLFRIGRLQYQIFMPAKEELLNQRKLMPGETYVNLHIPQGEKLAYSECVKSRAMADEFFATHTRFGQVKEITCHSWLLSPALKKMLPQTSNIIQFQSLFTIYELDPDSREAEERVFHKLKNNPQEYPEYTTLGRTLKQYLLHTGCPGSAYGIMNSDGSAKA